MHPLALTVIGCEAGQWAQGGACPAQFVSCTPTTRVRRCDGATVRGWHGGTVVRRYFLFFFFFLMRLYEATRLRGYEATRAVHHVTAPDVDRLCGYGGWHDAASARTGTVGGVMGVRWQCSHASVGFDRHLIVNSIISFKRKEKTPRCGGGGGGGSAAPYATAPARARGPWRRGPGQPGTRHRDRRSAP